MNLNKWMFWGGNLKPVYRENKKVRVPNRVTGIGLKDWLPKPISEPTEQNKAKGRDVNKDLTPKDQDKDKDLTRKDQDKDKDLTPKDQDKDKDLQ